MNTVRSKRPTYVELWKQYKADPENAAVRNELAMKYSDWIYRLAIYFYTTRNNRFPVDELVSVGFMQVLNLMKTFRLDGGCCFTAYSKLGILQSMQRFTSNGQYGPYAAWGRILKARQTYSNRLGRRVNDFELSSLLGITEKRLIQKLNYAGRGQSARLTSSVSQVASTDAVDFGWLIDVRDGVNRALATLPASHRIPVEKHLKEGWTLAEVGSQSGTSRQAVAQKLERATPKLLEALEYLAQGDRHQLRAG